MERKETDMRKRLRRRGCVAMLLVCGALFGMSACGSDAGSEIKPTAGTEATSSPVAEVTATPEPTVTPEPTATPTPKPTKAPTPAPVYVENAWFDNGKGADMAEFGATIEVKAPAAYTYKKPNVTYGEIITTKYYSDTCGREKNVIIALPAGYTEKKQYPVTYVLHGVGGSEKDMIGNGSSGARVIAQNLVEKGEAEEMILVFPNMYSSATQASFSGIDHENMAAYDNFVNDMANDLMPFIAENYSIATGRENTAVVGFSMGGRESLCLGFSRPDLFGYVGAIAPAPGLTPGKDMFLDHIGTFKEEELVFEKESPYVLMICSGDVDKVVGQFPKSYHNILNTNGVNHIWWEIPGSDHGDPAISSGLYNFCKSVFKGSQTTAGTEVEDGAEAEPTVAPEPTEAPVPTATPAPTATPKPAGDYAKDAWFDYGNGADMESVAELVEVKAPNAYQSKKSDVTYGKMVRTSYYSTTCEKNRNVIVLLPDGYTEEKEYPVLYVLHGIFGNETTMIGDGNSGLRITVGNMMAEGLAEDIILVFPYMFASKTMDACSGFDAKSVEAYDNFINDLVTDLMPFMADTYSVAEGRENTAIIGFSMGGRESLAIGFARPDLFGYVGAIAPAPGLTPGKDWAMTHPGQYAEAELVFEAESPELLMICSGDKDGTVGQFPKSYHNILMKNEVNHIWWEIPGSDHGDPAITSGIYNFCKAIFK